MRFLTATKIGGFAWEKAGRIWYVTLTTRLQADSDFQAAAGAIQLAGDRERKVSSSLEIGIGLQSSGERHIPNAACLFPGKPANLRSSEKERMIWNARIDVDTAVVVSRVQIIRHVGRLRILPELRIVVSRTGIFHGTQRDATYAWHEQP